MSFRRASKLAAVLATALGVIAPGPAGAAFSGANGRIVFATEFSRPSQIYTMRLDGSGLRQLTHVKKGHSAKGPEWSPDGTRIAYAKDYGIWVMNADGSGKTEITVTDGFRDKNPSWSPDGSRLAFAHCDISFGSAAYCDIARVNVDGTGFQTLVDDNWLNDGPAFSPDGSKIAFSSTRDGYVSAVWVADSDGANPVRISDPALQANSPEWSPDGGTLLFSSHAELPNSAVYSIAPDGTAQQQLSPPGNDWIQPQFSPDGTTIALLGPNTADPDTCCWDLYTMAADGTGLALIEHPRAGMVGLDWGPKAVT